MNSGLTSNQHIPYLFGYKMGFFLSLERLQIGKSVPSNLVKIRVLPFLNSPKDLDPSNKTELYFWDCFGRKKTLSYNQRNMVGHMKTGPELKLKSRLKDRRRGY